MFKRRLANSLLSALHSKSNKIVILYGPRQVGKTTLLNEITANSGLKVLSINADQSKYVDVLSSRDLNRLTALVSGYDCLFIDEAQRVPNIGINLKLLHDHHKELRIIASGSSSFELANQVKEPLTGRTKTFHLFPMSFLELSDHMNAFELNDKLLECLQFGLYPDVMTLKNLAEKENHLKELASSYLYKDVLELETIRYGGKLRQLLQLLAFQIGSQVSIAELGRALGLAQETTAHYIQLLENAFVIFRLSGLSRNLRTEVTKMDKIYFYDVGIRNAVIDNLKTIPDRNDAGALFENFIIAERMKRNHYLIYSTRHYFWRLNTGAEIDFIEEHQGDLKGYEIKFNRSQPKAPQSWKNAYPTAEFEGVNRDNYLSVVT